MGNYEALARRFAKANLRAEVIQQRARDAPPTTSGAVPPDVFQMTILGEGRNEFFRISPGANTNRVEAEGIDCERHQLVLLVQEPARAFVERAWKHRLELNRSIVRVIREDHTHVWFERWTDARKRHFLCGRDERQLFICQLPRAVTTVREAHRVLQAPAVVWSKGKVVRQGEWFFIAPSAHELAAMAIAVRTLRTVVRAHASIGRGGKPHVADEIVTVPTTVVASARVERTVLVRGRVRHPDHEPVYLASWSKVVRNTEPVAADGVARMAGIRWID